MSLHATSSCDGSSAGTWTFAPPSLKRHVSSPMVAVVRFVCRCLRCGCFGWSILRPFHTHPVPRTVRIGRGDTFPSPSRGFSPLRMGPIPLPSASLSSALLVHLMPLFPSIPGSRSIAPDRVLSRRMGGWLGSQVHDHRIWSLGPSKDWSDLSGWDVDLWLPRIKLGSQRCPSNTPYIDPIWPQAHTTTHPRQETEPTHTCHGRPTSETRQAGPRELRRGRRRRANANGTRRKGALENEARRETRGAWAKTSKIIALGTDQFRPKGGIRIRKKKGRGHPRHECSSGVQARSAKDHRTSNMDVDMACVGFRRTPLAGRTVVGVVPPCPQPRVAPSHPRRSGSERPESTCGKGRFEKGGIHWRWWEHPWWWC